LGNIGKLIEFRRRSPARVRPGENVAAGAALGVKPQDEVQSTLLAVRGQNLRLRTLLQNGANESLYFRRHLPSYTMVVVSLTHLFEASLELFRQQKGDPQYLTDIGPQLSAVYEATELELQMLVDAVGSGKEINNDRLKSTFWNVWPIGDDSAIRPVTPGNFGRRESNFRQELAARHGLSIDAGSTEVCSACG
jgi:hypothetical protein